MAVKGLGVGALGACLLCAASAQAQVAVLTQRYDNQRTGANLAETTLNQTNVAAGSFGLVFSLPVDGQLYAQPLIVPQISIPGAGTHDLLILCTEHDSVYAFDAEDPAQTAPLWQVSLGTSVQSTDLSCNDMTPETGITSTPVVDPTSGLLYVIAKTITAGTYANTIHALDLTTGLDAMPPQTVAPSITGDGGVTATFTGLRHFSRPGLLLSNGIVYAGFGSHCDFGSYHGWIVGYDAATLSQKYAFTPTPNGSEGSIWQAGGGLIADAQGDLYGGVANGTFDWAQGGEDIGESVVKWGPDLTVLNWFSPANEADMSNADTDLGSTPAVLWDSPPMLLSGDKGGTLRVLDPTNLGGQQPNDTGLLGQLQFGSGLFVGPILWDGPTGLTLFFWSSGDPLTSYTYGSGTFSSLAHGSVSAPGGKTGGVLTLSSNGSLAGTGIVWGSVPSGPSGGNLVGGNFFAFSADDVTKELWSSTANPADSVGNFAKFAQPVVANGLVYLDTFSSVLNVYGLLPGTSAGTTSAGTTAAAASTSAGTSGGKTTGASIAAATTSGPSVSAVSSASGSTGRSTGTSAGASVATTASASGISAGSTGKTTGREASTTAGATTGGGTSSGAAASTGAGLVPDAGAPHLNVTGTGCGCSAGESDGSVGPWLGLGLGLAFGLRRRRRGAR